MEEEWGEMEKRMKSTLGEVEEEQKKGKRRKRGWWNEECKEKKREVRRELRKWRKNRGGKEKFREKKE